MLLEYMRRANPSALALLLACATIASCDSSKSNQAESKRIRSKLEAIPLDRKVQFTNDEWTYILTGRQYYVLRRGGTELPFTNAYWHTHQKGIYFCAACSNPLFSSDAKYDSGTGWPSFWQPIGREAISAASHSSFGGGNEITCARCGSHLGHVFDDGPRPSGLRYCMNSAALKFVKAVGN
jgi:peptide-methionine (R)-S-oxide reductase